MAPEIKCPQCGNLFEPNESIREEIQKEVNVKAEEWKKKKEKELEESLKNKLRHYNSNITQKQNKIIKI